MTALAETSRQLDETSLMPVKEGVDAAIENVAVSLQATFYVYLWTGVVEEISPATSIAVTPDSVIVLSGAQTVATYPRSAVVFCSDTRTPPFQY